MGHSVLNLNLQDFYCQFPCCKSLKAVGSVTSELMACIQLAECTRQLLTRKKKSFAAFYRTVGDTKKASCCNHVAVTIKTTHPETSLKSAAGSLQYQTLKLVLDLEHSNNFA